MINKRILIISTYPIKNPRHGGQKRVSAMVREYKKIFSQVRFVAVYKGYYPDRGPDDIFVESSGGWDPGLTPFIGDVIAGEAIYDSPRVRKRVTSLLRSFRPDIIQVEQTFPYLGLKPLLAELGLKPTIILSSHNIEHAMKIEVLKSIGVKSSIYRPVADKIQAIEGQLSKDAALTIAVSEQDAKSHQQMGARRTVVAPNGIDKAVTSPAATDYWQTYKQAHHINRTVTFIASAHPPAWVGFLQMVGDRMGFIPTDSRLLLAGSIADYFEQNFHAEKPEHYTFWQRVNPVGRLSEDRLSGLIHSTDVLILPITEGGGSNLKTAEAILSGRKVVATSYAFRSFEKYQKLPNIYIADSPEEFRGAIVKALDSSLEPRTPTQEELAQKVQWHYSLKSAVEEAKKL